ncbi:MAG: PilZ domain-containing protein [Deltaproteobacteria bacterium]|nr:MAG: PilZ domain-containing protein [Deltaproteobacteria bacterium]
MSRIGGKVGSGASSCAQMPLPHPHVRAGDEISGERRDEEWSPQARNYRLNLSRGTLLAMLDPRNAKSTLLPVALVRYRFGSTANIPLHFRENNGRSLFFYPSELPHRDGQWIFVEFVVAGSDVPCLARGRVRTQHNARFTGSWLEFPTPDLPLIMSDLAQTRRAHERLPIDVTASVRCADGAKLVCRIADVSADGLRLSGLPFLLKADEDLSIEMVGMPRAQSDLGKGRVVWVRAQEAGIHFRGRGPLNPSLVKLVEQAVAVRSSAIEFVHPDSCSCRNGERPLEPQLPGTGR